MVIPSKLNGMPTANEEIVNKRSHFNPQNIMQLEQQVCSLELAKRLKELGVKQESVWMWRFSRYYVDWKSTQDEHLHLSRHDTVAGATYSLGDDGQSEAVSAFTVAELGEMLPDGSWTQQFKHELEWQTVWGRAVEKVFTAPTEADARAKMLIYLLENNLITLQ